MPVVAYADPSATHNPSSGGVAPASWFVLLEANERSIRGRVAARIYQPTTEDFAIPGPTVLTLGSTDFNNGMDVSVANTIKIPASYGGKYFVLGSCRITTIPSALNTCQMAVAVNGTDTLMEIASRSSATGSSNTLSICAPLRLAVADLLTLRVTTQGLSDADTDVTVSHPSLAAFWRSA
jgi:hypothetical protein